MAAIVPSILETTEDGFLDKLAQVTKLPEVSRIQVDFADGEFVPNKTVDIAGIEPLSPAFTWEAHLMVKEPVDFLDYQIAGFGILAVHYEAFASKNMIEPALKQIRELGMKTALAINPETPVEVLLEFKDLADQFLLLGVNPGFQGHEFISETVQRVKQLREQLPHAILEVDGGIKPALVKPLVEAGADFLVVGSALFSRESLRESFDLLEKEINLKT